MTAVSVVMATYDRREACRAAIESALAQDWQPMEVVVADDGSSDGTREMLERWARTEPRLRVLPPALRAGRPAPPRNRAVAAARGEWIALLDDDDRWLPNRLAAQAPYLGHDWDVVAGNALNSAGRAYFRDAQDVSTPSRRALLRGNPIVLSTAVVRADLLRRVGGFPEEPWMAGIEDYALWLALADAQARFVVLGAPLAHYADAGEGRLSERRSVELAVARLFWRRWRARPRDQDLRRAAFRRASYALTLTRDAMLGR